MNQGALAVEPMPTAEASSAAKPARWEDGISASAADVGAMIANYSIEVLPRTAARIESFRDLLPAGTRIYIANVEGTDFSDMLATARRLSDEGFAVMPHFPARLIPDRLTLETWIGRYRDEAGVSEALVLGGGVRAPAGQFNSSMQVLETGLFDRYGFSRLHVAGHPEGNSDIDRDGSSLVVDAALLWKQRFSAQTDAKMAITTQFFFEAGPVIAWSERVRAMGVTLPIHIGIAGPARLQTLIKYGLDCGVGASIKVLKRRALDVGKLLLPYEPDDVLADLAAFRAREPARAPAQIHFFPLGGIKACVAYAANRMGTMATAGVP